MPVSTDPEPVLEARRVSKRFPGVLALDEVSCALRPGEVHALVGENGAGKSTLIKVLTGVYRPDGGELRYRGEPVTFATPLQAQRSGISTIYQEVNLVPMMSVARNLLLGREPRNRFGIIDVAEMNARAERLLAEYGVRTDVRRPLRSLGVGAQQMVALARAASVDARVIVMDEPTSSLEPREVETLFGVVAELRRRGLAVVYVSHRMEELYRICDRVTVLRDGRLVHTGPLAELDRLELISLMLGRDLAAAPARRSTRGRPAASGSGGDGAGHPAPRTAAREAGPRGHAAHGGRAPVVEARNLTRRHVLHGVSVAVRPGEVVGLGGLLGSGRSETAKAIAGAVPLDDGEVIVAGRPLRRRTTTAAVRAGVSLLPEDRKAEGIVPTLSVRENIALAALPRLSRAGIVSDERIDRIVETFMRRLRIKAASPHQRVSELSGGNQQKVLLARWLAVQPKVLLLDEPTRGIDVGAKAEVRALIDELAEEGLGVLLISSDLQELVDGSDRVVVLREGAVVGELRGDEVTEQAIMATIARSRGADAATAAGPGEGEQDV
ncbi:sugar ABC transporter ATP-binding protein [Thermopolyspora flexuosa]|uniref:Monosaccharide ABC transporter ATP-binding protein (CUT2 family) n=1 Tax=Thermopolyspora flexuosa TaxID=103836 RepID=A0A543J4C3_9ACTN|nr:sugar ABC transporter ATP-binding protein [Thermopolyspora flexuosa]TQM77686.1 monosaccharide ABC transporter ATP-binding protein (CUT2 family) [Thermopolyspora flexuosa]GGM71512.1 sugar ABC transporter ATP-binding protein [Thermopolyspora flexuosa]